MKKNIVDPHEHTIRPLRVHGNRALAILDAFENNSLTFEVLVIWFMTDRRPMNPLIITGTSGFEHETNFLFVLFHNMGKLVFDGAKIGIPPTELQRARVIAQRWIDYEVKFPEIKY